MAVLRVTSTKSWMVGCVCTYVGLLLYTFLTLKPDVKFELGDQGTRQVRDAHLQVRSFQEKRFRQYQLTEENRTGCGEHGAGVSLSDGERKVGIAQQVIEGFSLIASDKVALDKALSDKRHEQCRSLTYPDDLPTVSVIIIFADEARSVLMRTVHSVVNRTPPRLLHEVILVDDASIKVHLLEELDAYVVGAWPDGIVRVLRLPTRSGLIRARVAGARAATGDAIAVLDGHIEVTKGWTGWGEHGTPVSLSETERAVGSAQGSTEGYSLIASDKVALDRALKDMRHEQCRSLTYPDDLPTVSVIIIFADEARSMLLRTVHSVVNRTPPRLLHEVILVDDASTKAYLLEELDAYVAGAWPDGIVRVLRLPTRSGLIRARLAGARAATGDAIAVLDGHIEVTKGWAEPLLARIKEKPTTLVTPVVDSVHPETLEYVIGDPKATVTFRWDMHYEWLPYKAKDNISAIPSASMVGCAFAMDRHMFFKLGSFDEDMEVWGCENTEIGFRLWMCGGGMEIVPCSRLAHLFRKARPYKTPPKLDYYGINSQRVAEVWLDEYRRYYYYAKPERQNSTYGNITKRLALKEKLKCKSFRWFMTEAFPDSFVYDKNVQGWGYVKNLGNNMCLDSFGKDEQMNFQLQMYPCQTNHATHFTQLFSLTNDHRLRRQFSCATYPGSSPGQNITMAYSCYHNYSLPWKWDYKQDTKQIVYSSNGFCLDSSQINVSTLSPCTNTTSQQWTFQYKGDS